MRSELMASIYDKALKRKDFSGIVSKDTKAEVAKEPASNGVETKESKRGSLRAAIRLFLLKFG